MKNLTLAVTACAALLCASCRTPTAGVRVESYPSTQMTPSSRLMSDTLLVEEAKVGVVNDLLRVNVRALSVRDTSKKRSVWTSKTLQYEYRFRWLDAAGFEIDGGTRGWTSVTVSDNDRVHMQGVAPNNKATDYQFMVRFPDRI